MNLTKTRIRTAAGENVATAKAVRFAKEEGKKVIKVVKVQAFTGGFEVTLMVEDDPAFDPFAGLS